MKTADINVTLIEGYLKLMENLSSSNKQALIDGLSLSLERKITNKKSSFKSSFGAFESEISAEQLIKTIQTSRTNNRQIEPF